MITCFCVPVSSGSGAAPVPAASGSALKPSDAAAAAGAAAAARAASAPGASLVPGPAPTVQPPQQAGQPSRAPAPASSESAAFHLPVYLSSGAHVHCSVQSGQTAQSLHECAADWFYKNQMFSETLPMLSGSIFKEEHAMLQAMMAVTR